MKYRDAAEKLRAPQDLKDRTVAAMEGRAAPRRAPRRRWLPATAAVALLLLSALLLQLPFGGGGPAGVAQALAVAQYPAVAPRPLESDYIDPATGDLDAEAYSKAYNDWMDANEDVNYYHHLGRADDSYVSSLSGFSRAALTQALSNADGENLVYSPANVYMALALLTELTGGSTRQQLLDALGVSDHATLRTQTQRLWRQLYYDGETRVTHLANSLWLNEDIAFRQNTLDFLADNYFASSYQGKMGSEDLDRAMHSWANQQTGGLLENHINGLSTPPETALVLLSTVYFRARWSSEFDPAKTYRQDFHCVDGTISTLDFMHMKTERNYLFSDNFSAIQLDLGGSANMVLILPDEGVTAEELLADPGALDVLTSSGAIGSDRWADRTVMAKVELSMPKFDVSSTLDLTSQLRALGITGLFSPAADFTPLTDTAGISVTKATHAARVTVDEEGCTATAIVELLCGGMPPQPTETVYFTLDRPFLFAITGADGLPLFAGVVNRL